MEFMSTPASYPDHWHGPLLYVDLDVACVEIIRLIVENVKKKKIKKDTGCQMALTIFMAIRRIHNG